MELLASSVPDLQGVWTACAHSRVARNVNQATFRMVWDALCALIKCMGARSVQEVKHVLSVQIVS